MTTFNECLNEQTWALWEVLWYPEDLHAPNEGVRTYVVAPDMDTAGKTITANPADIRSVTRVGNGGVIIAAPQHFLRPAFPYENPRTTAETEAMLNHMADVHLTPTEEKK